LKKNFNEFEFSTTSGNKYTFYPSINAIFYSKQLQINNRRDLVEKLPGFIKTENKNYFDFLDSKWIEKYLLSYGYTELVLEVTTSCNLRCKYCVFSGNYDCQREHGEEHMGKDIALKSIDLYFNKIIEGESYNPNRKPVVAFYGGEPLLNFPLIMECVDYINKIYEGEVVYSITTNGTLLTGDIIDFLLNKKFYIVLSLDGNKENHNRNRVFKNGNGTFDIIIDNVKKIKKRHKLPIFVNCVYDFKTNLVDVAEFFDKNFNLFVCLVISSVNPYHTNYYEQFSEQDMIDFKYNEHLIREKFLKNNKEKETNKLSFINKYFGSTCMRIFMKQTNFTDTNKKLVKNTGSCVPGTKLFVDISGDIYTCEKVTKEIKIGNVYSGFNYKIIADIINDLNIITKNRCKGCLLENNCTLCYTSILNEKCVKIEEKLCSNQINQFKKDISFAYSVAEKDPVWINNYIADYHKKIKEMAVRIR